MNDSAAEHELLYGEVTDELIAELRSGRRPDTAVWARRYPAVGGDIAQHLSELEAILRCGACASDATGHSDDTVCDVPTQLGEFRLVREIGRGGMGIVYEAEQQSLRRRVALKVLPFASLLEAHRLQRFQNESQAAALLRHPNIVPVFGVGCDRGIHYYAMQLVEGRSLAAYVADLRSKIPDRTLLGSRRAPPNLPPDHVRVVAAWGVQAAEALQYAHELGVVHRDVKPGNLLLDHRGVVWITDFGLARSFGDRDLTTTGDVVGSLRYMAPEQALGVKGVVDHRADVYGLGATLYELLTLEPVVPGSGRDELYRHLIRGEPRLPRSMNPGIPRDLETVVLKALSKEPTARYATGQEFAEDLKRFLEQRPVLARRPTLAERARHWVRRNPVLVGATTVVLLVVAVASAASAFFINKEREKTRIERDQANVQREVARARRLEAVRAVNKLYAEFGQEWIAEQPQLEDMQRRFALDALAFSEKLGQDPDDDPQFQLELALAHRRAGDMHIKLGEPAKGAAAYEKAVRLLEELRRNYPSVSEYLTELAITHTEEAKWRMTAGEIAATETAIEPALDLWRQAISSVDVRPLHRHNLAQSLQVRGMIRLAKGQSKYAENDLREAQSLLEDLAAKFPDDPRYSESLCRNYVDLGNVLVESNGPAGESGKLFSFARERFSKLPQNFRDSPSRRRFESIIHQSIGRQRQATGPFVFAEVPIKRAIEIKCKLVSDFPKVPNYRMELAEALSNFGVLMFALGRYDDAAKQFRAAQSSLDALADVSPRHPKYGYYRALNHLNLTAALREMNRPVDAVIEGVFAIARLEQLIRDHPQVQAYRKMLAIVKTTMGWLCWCGSHRSEAHDFFVSARELRIQLALESPATPNEAAGLAWALATCPDPEVRDANEIVRWADDGLRLKSDHQQCWLAIGHAHCRDRATADEAVRALEKSRVLAGGGDSYHWFGLAIAHQNLGHRLMAWACYIRGCGWMDCRNQRGIELMTLRAEAEVMLGLTDRKAVDLHSLNKPK